MADATESGSAPTANPADGGTRGRFCLFQVSGIKVTIDYSWLIIFVLVLASLSAGYFPRAFPEYSTQLYWIAGFVATLFFFAGIVIHELAHSLVAVRSGIEIPEITLFLFGGVSSMAEEPADPQTELKVAIAGPLASFVLAGIFWLITSAISGKAPGLVTAVFEYLAYINIALGVFNLVPGYPLDGGRILRALIWWRTGSVTRGTKWASDMGQGFAWALMILGGLQIFSGALIGGLWLIFIGMFLRGIAARGYQEVIMKQSMEGATVREHMVEDVETIPPDVTLDEAASQYFLRYGHGGYPVVKDGRTVGLLCLAQVKDVPDDERGAKRAEEVMLPLDDDIKISPDASLVDALKKMNRTGIGRLIVTDGNRPAGLITKTGLLRFLEFKQELGKV